MALLTTIQQIQVEYVSQYLTAEDVAKGDLFGPRLAPSTPIVNYMDRKAVEWMYNLDTSNDTLVLTGNYMYSHCKKNARALNIINGGGGGSVAPVNPVANIFPIYITSADFESDGISYNNNNLIGVSIMIFINEVSQQWLVASATTFAYTATGIQILVPGFDASSYDYSIVIQRLGTG